MSLHIRNPHGLRTSRCFVAVVGLAAIVLWSGGDNAPTWEHAGRDTATVPRGWETTHPGRGITAHHPPIWGTYPYETVFIGGFSTVGYLSTERLHKPCIYVYAADGREHAKGVCAPLLRHLSSSGVLIQWNREQPPRRNPLTSYPGTPTILAGRAARLQTINAPKWCLSIGGARLVLAAIATSTDPRGEERWSVTACLGPTHAAVNEADVRTMLRTATLPSR